MEKVKVTGSTWWRRLFAFIGPAYLVSVGYMDPGNWATDIEAGSRFGYSLIWVLLASNIMAVLLQTLSARLGIVTGYDLAQGCRKEYPPFIRIILWVLAEIAIAATDLAEVLGTIIGLNLLFGLPLLWGAAVTAFDTFLLLAIQKLGIRKMEAFIIMLIATIASCFLIELFITKPDWPQIAGGFIVNMPQGALFIATGIIGATVMPHNLYLHSSLVQSRSIAKTYTGRAEASKYNFFDSAIALNAAFFVNAAILIVAAASFYTRGIVVTEIQQAHNLLTPVLGSTIAPILFAAALLASGQSSTLTGTISGQIVMEGFLNFKMRPWVRRVFTRSVALIPAVFVIAISGNKGTYHLLILSQVILSLQLPFAVIPLVHFTSDKDKMGNFVNRLWLKLFAWTIAGVITFLNLWLVYNELIIVVADVPYWAFVIFFAVIVFLASVLFYIAIAPFFGVKKKWESGIITRGEIIAKNLTLKTIKNIGVAIENGPGDNDIISMALSIAKPDQAKLTLVHILESPGALVYGDLSETQHSLQDEAYIEELVREIEKPNLPVDYCLRNGKPVQSIIAIAKEYRFDILVMGTHGHTGINDIIFGQTVNGVRHSLDIPILTVRVKDTTTTETPIFEKKITNN